MRQDKILTQILQAIKDRDPIHKQIPNQGKIVFNKIVPYLFVYRIPDSEKDRMLSELAKSEQASIIFNDQHNGEDLNTWIPLISKALADEFGTCLLVEVWTAPSNQTEDIAIHLSQKNALDLAEYLAKNIRNEAHELFVDLKKTSKLPCAPNMPSIVEPSTAKANIVIALGISIRQRYQSLEGKHLPLLARIFRESLAKSLSRLFFEFVRLHTNIRAAHFKMKVHERLNEQIYEIDNVLLKESTKFDFLLLTTPINSHEAWLQFQKDGFRKAPVFHYRPIPVDPDLVKRNLYNLPIEDIYDPTIAYLFRDKRRELDDMMTMLASRNTPDFKYGSLMVFGNVSDELFDMAKALLIAIDSTSTAEIEEEQDYIHAPEFAKLAEQELTYLKQQSPKFGSTVRIRDDISGVMVNHGVLNISKQYKIARHRAPALIQHEVGTHIVTYFNGKDQNFSIFRQGVPGYEQLQEGLAVLAEFLVDGLTNDRLRILAGRVLAVRHMLMGHSFVETFSMLHEDFEFGIKTSYSMTMRVFRSGGLTKDAVYLQGFVELIRYIQEGGDLKILTIGKIREDYLPIIKDLMQRGILRHPTLTPRYLQSPFVEKLNNMQHFSSIFKMINY